MSNQNKANAALKRLTKKLSAMRATLSKNERILLDRLVLGEQVVAHGLTTDAAKAVKAAKKQTEVAAHALTTDAAKAVKAVKGGTEVAAHALTTDAAKAVKAVKGGTEVAAHALTTDAAKAVKAAKKVTDVAAHQLSDAIKPRKVTRVTEPQAALNQLIQFDATTGGYKVTDAAK